MQKEIEKLANIAALNTQTLTDVMVILSDLQKRLVAVETKLVEMKTAFVPKEVK